MGNLRVIFRKIVKKIRIIEKRLIKLIYAWVTGLPTLHGYVKFSDFAILEDMTHKFVYFTDFKVVFSAILAKYLICIQRRYVSRVGQSEKMWKSLLLAGGEGGGGGGGGATT